MKKRQRKEKLIEDGIKDAREGKLRKYNPRTKKLDKQVEKIFKEETSTIAPESTTITTHWPIQIDFFNDTKKPIRIRATAFTHPNNPDMIPPCYAEKIYIKSGFLKLWDDGDGFTLLVE